MSTNRKISQKQRWIIQTVVTGNAPDKLNNNEQSWVDMDQLLELLPYETTKESIQFSLRHLMKRGYIVNDEPQVRRGRKRRVLAPTTKSVILMSPSNSDDISMKEFEDLTKSAHSVVSKKRKTAHSVA